MANTTRKAGLTDADVSGVLALNRAAGRFLISGAWQPYADARARGLQSTWRQIAEGFPADSSLPIWTLLRQVATFDPMPYWMMVSAPVLVVYGAEDEKDNVPVAESVRRLEYGFAAARKTNYRIIVLPGLGHSLMDKPGRLAPAFTSALQAWLAEIK